MPKPKSGKPTADSAVALASPTQPLETRGVGYEKGLQLQEVSRQSGDIFPVYAPAVITLKDMEASIKKLNQFIEQNYDRGGIIAVLQKNKFDEHFKIPADFRLSWLMTIAKAYALLTQMLQTDPVPEKPSGMVTLYLRKESPAWAFMPMLIGSYIFVDPDDDNAAHLSHVEMAKFKGVAATTFYVKRITLRDMVHFKQILSRILNGSTAQKISLTPEQYQELIADNAISEQEKYREIAIHYFTQVLQSEKLTDPEEPLLERSKVYAAARQNDLAIADLDRLLAKKPDSLEGLKARAQWHLQQNQLEKAQADFVALKRINPRSFDAEYGLVKILALQKKFDEVFAVLDKMKIPAAFSKKLKLFRAMVLLTKSTAAQGTQLLAEFEQALQLLLEVLLENPLEIYEVFSEIHHESSQNADKLIMLKVCEMLFAEQPKWKQNFVVMDFYLYLIVDLSGPEKTPEILQRALQACEGLRAHAQAHTFEIDKLQAVLCKQYASMCESAEEKNSYYTKALIFFARVLEKDPEDWQTLNEMGRISGQIEDFSKSILHFRQSLQKKPSNNLDAHLGLGNAYIAQGDAVAAHQHLEQAYLLNPENSQIALVLGQLDFECGDYEKSKFYLQKAAVHAPEDVIINTLLYAIDFYQGRSGGPAHLKKLLKKYPKHPYILCVLGTIQNECANHERALEFLEQVPINEIPTPVELRALYGKAVALRGLGRLQEAADCLELFLKHKEWADFWVEYAELNDRLGHAEIARQAIEKIFPFRDSNLLKFPVVENDVKKAQATIKALVKKPESPQVSFPYITVALEILILLYLDRAEAEKEPQASALACAVLNILLSTYPTHKNALLQRGQIHFDGGDYAAASADLAAWRGLNAAAQKLTAVECQAHAQTLTTLGIAYMRLANEKMDPLALDCFEQAHQLDPQSLTIKIHLGAMCCLLDQNAVALLVLQTAQAQLDLNCLLGKLPSLTDRQMLSFYLGLTHRELGDWEQAEMMLAQALQQDEHNDLAREYHQQLVDARCAREAQKIEAQKMAAQVTVASEQAVQEPAAIAEPAVTIIMDPIAIESETISLTVGAASFWQERPRTVLQEPKDEVSHQFK